MCDANATGMGGLYFILMDTTEISLLWRQRFPDWICTQLSSFKNPNGFIINSDLELAGSMEQNEILTQAENISKKTTHNSYDNNAAFFWQRKVADTTTVGPAAFLLYLHLSAGISLMLKYCHILICTFHR